MCGFLNKKLDLFVMFGSPLYCVVPAFIAIAIAYPSLLFAGVFSPLVLVLAALARSSIKTRSWMNVIHSASGFMSLLLLIGTSFFDAFQNETPATQLACLDAHAVSLMLAVNLIPYTPGMGLVDTLAFGAPMWNYWRDDDAKPKESSVISLVLGYVTLGLWIVLAYHLDAGSSLMPGGGIFGHIVAVHMISTAVQGMASVHESQSLCDWKMAIVAALFSMHLGVGMGVVILHNSFLE